MSSSRLRAEKAGYVRSLAEFPPERSIYEEQLLAICLSMFEKEIILKGQPRARYLLLVEPQCSVDRKLPANAWHVGDQKQIE